MATIASGDRILVVAADDQLGRRLVNLITTSESASSNDRIIPWRISNKYYDANVHFSIFVVGLDDVNYVAPAERDADGAPAVIYAFERATDMSYRPHFLRFAATHSAVIDDAEVYIAACLPTLDAETNTENDLEDEEAVDDFFSQYRFEYVNTLEVNDTTMSQSSDDMTGINRIREALHTIMWPSLIRKKTPATDRSMPVVFNDDSIDGVGGLSLSLNVDDITEDVARSLFTLPDDALQEHELAAFEAWLDQPPDPVWKKPQNERSTRKDNPAQLQSTPLNRFDDDFSEFISATQTPAPLSNTFTSPTRVQGSLLSNTLEDDPFIPSKTDIAAASSRIFKQAADDADADGLDAFDLNQMLSTLQAMKEEISLIDDIDKRRRVAATAALGLVSGLGLGAGDDDDDRSELGELLTV